MGSQLAINGGERWLAPGTIKPWPPIESVDEQLVLQSLRGERHAWGPNCAALEKEWAAWNGNRFCCATNSGTAALHMGVCASGVCAGDEVITTSFSWTSTATCILHHNAIPVFVDIDFATMNIDASRIEAAISERTRAILPVHLHGLPAEMDTILDIARRHGLKVIEDACQAHGALYRGRKVGTLGDCAAFSLNQNKMLSAGEGGLFVTDSETMNRNARALMSFGEFVAPHEDRDYHSYALGWMYRTCDLAAAFARAQLRRLDSFIASARQLAAVVTEELQGVPGLILPVEPEGRKHNYYNYVVRLDVDALGYGGPRRRLRDAVVAALNAEGIPCAGWQAWILPQMTVFQARNGYGRGCPWTCKGAREVNYDPQQFPNALRHVETYFMVPGLRAPNTPETARMVATGIRKVMENLSELDVEKALARQ